MKHNIPQCLDILTDILDGVEIELFGEQGIRSASVIYKGHEITHDDFLMFKRIIDRARRRNESEGRNTKRYLVKNKKYHQKVALLSYYKRKKVKTSNDYKRIEEIQNEIDDIIKQLRYDREHYEEDKANLIFRNRGDE